MCLEKEKNALSISASALVDASSYPFTISLGCRPSTSSCSAFFSISPASMITAFVASPIYAHARKPQNDEDRGGENGREAYLRLLRLRRHDQ